MPENMQHVFDVEEHLIFRTTLTVAQAGFYRVKFRYAHSNWDAWLKMDVMGEAGQSLTYIPPLPNKYTETTMLIYLFAGVNRISMAPRFDHPMDIREIVLLEEQPELKPYAVPSGDCF
mgnify:FL=1